MQFPYFIIWSIHTVGGGQIFLDFSFLFFSVCLQVNYSDVILDDFLCSFFANILGPWITAYMQSSILFLLFLKHILYVILSVRLYASSSISLFFGSTVWVPPLSSLREVQSILQEVLAR